MQNKDCTNNTEENDGMTVAEPTVNIDFHRTLSFFERHDSSSGMDMAMPLHEGFDVLRSRIKEKYRGKENSLIS